MATARWFFQEEPQSRFVIQEHLRQDYWRAGPAALWLDVTQVTLPHKAQGYWHDLKLEWEWEPRNYLILRADRADKEMIRATNLQLGFKPARQYEEEDGRYVVEWRLAGQVIDEPPTQLAATPVIDTAQP